MTPAAWIMMLVTWAVVSTVAGRLFFIVLRSKSAPGSTDEAGEAEPSMRRPPD